MNCPKCGTISNENAKFCGVCGSTLSLQTTNNETVKEVEQLEETTSVNYQEQKETNQLIVEQQEEKTNINVQVEIPEIQRPVIEPSINLEANNNIVNQPNKKNNNKLIIIIIAVVALIAVIFAVVALIPTEEKKTKEKLNTIFDQEKLIRVKSNDMYGYINTKGKFVIPAKYGYATVFEGGYAVVIDSVQKENEVVTMYQLIDKKGNVKIESEREIKYLSEKGLWLIDDELYNQNLKKISPEDVRVEEEDDYFIWVSSKKNTGGIMNAEGKITYTYSFKEGEDYISITPSNVDEDMKDDTYCIVNIENEKYAIVNCNDGTVVYDYTDKYISDDYDNIFEIKDHDTFKRQELVFVYQNKIVYQTQNSEIDLQRYSNDNYITIRDGSKPYSERYSYIDLKTLKISTEAPEDDSEDETTDEWEKLTGYKKFNCSTGYGLIKEEEIVIPCELERIEYLKVPVYQYLASTGKQYIYGYGEDDKIYIIDIKTNKTISELEGVSITQSEESTFIKYQSPDYKKEIVYNLITKKQLGFSDSENTITVYSNYFTVKNYKEDTIKYYNTDAELIYTEKA